MLTSDLHIHTKGKYAPEYMHAHIQMIYMSRQGRLYSRPKPCLFVTTGYASPSAPPVLPVPGTCLLCRLLLGPCGSKCHKVIL